MPPHSTISFSGSWLIFEKVGNDVRVVEVATFERDSITLKRSGFLGLVDAKEFRTELWPPARYTGPISCNIGEFSQTMCILPPPALFWSFREEGIVTVDRVALEKEPFGDMYCRNLGVDSDFPRYTRTFWAINDKGVVAISEERSGHVSLQWTDYRPEDSSVNVSSMALTFPINTIENTCVTCIAGVGDNILSLPVTECRAIKPKELEDSMMDCDCHLYRFLAALCALGLVCLLSTLIYSCVSTMAATSDSYFPTKHKRGKRCLNGNDSVPIVSLRRLRKCAASLAD